MSIPFTGTRARVFDKDGNPLSYGRISFYDAGTTILKNVYLSHIEEVSNLAQNPTPLDSDGYVYNNNGIWLSAGPYKVVIEKSDGAGGYITEWEIDYVPGDGVIDSHIISSSVVETVTDLRLITPGAYALVYVEGYNSKGDNGGGWFRWEAVAPSTEDGGAYIFPTSGGVGCWVRLFNDDSIRPEQWGAFADDNTLTVATQWANMRDYAKANPEASHIYIGDGDWYVNASITFDGDITVEVSADAYFKNNLAGNITVAFTCEDAIIHGATRKCDPYNPGTPTSTIYFSPANRARRAHADWWGTMERAAQITTGTTLPVVLSQGAYNITTVVDLTGINLVFENGSYLNVTTGSYQSVKVDQFLVNQNYHVFSGNLDDYDFGSRKEINISWFNVWQTTQGTGVDSTKYDALILTLTNGGNNSLTINWNESWDYTFNQAEVSGSSYTNSRLVCNHNITNGTLKFDIDRTFGTIDECIRGGIDPSGSKYPVLYNSEIDIAWFGAIPKKQDSTTYTLNANAIKYAAYVQLGSTESSSQGVFVTGGGKYYTNSGIVLDTTTEAFAFKDISLEAHRLGSGSTGLFLVGGDLIMNNVRLNIDKDLSAINQTSGYLWLNNCYITSSYETTVIYSTADGELVKIVDSQIVGGNLILTLLGVGSAVLFNGSRFINTYAFNSASNSVIASTIGTITGCYFSKGSVTFTESKGLIITGNVFDSNASVLFIVPHTLAFTNNTMSRSSDSVEFIIFAGDSASFVVEGVVVKNNVFVYTGVNDMRAFGGNNLSLTGHTATITDNTTTNDHLIVNSNFIKSTTSFTDVDPRYLVLVGMSSQFDYSKGPGPAWTDPPVYTINKTVSPNEIYLDGNAAPTMGPGTQVDVEDNLNISNGQHVVISSTYDSGTNLTQVQLEAAVSVPTQDPASGTIRPFTKLSSTQNAERRLAISYDSNAGVYHD